VRVADDVGVGGEAGVYGGVLHDQRLVRLDRDGAERALARRLAVGQPDARLRPLAVDVDQRDERDRHVE
jgi:hypothetical protein